MPLSDPNFQNLSGRFRINSSKQPVSAGIKRNRESRVCNQCRRAKLRCDKGQPCGSCVKRNEGGFCSYKRSTDSTKDAEITSLAEGRLLQLESVVKKLMQHQPLTPPSDGILPDSQPLYDLGSAVARDQIDGSNSGEGAYVGPTHWSTVLEDIQEIRLAISNYATAAGSEASLQATGHAIEKELIFGIIDEDDTIQGIVTQYLPGRTQVDRYLSIYFSGETYVIPFIHALHFQKEYDEFWLHISATNPLWVSILFSICYLASIIGGTSNSYRSNPVGSAEGNPVLHEAAAKCLILGQYQKPQRFAVEALAMYGFCKNMRQLDPCRETGTILSMVIRLAYQMGYHRDPDNLGSISTFDGEMRRRCWAAIKQMDLMISFQLGLPSNIRMENCDARPPRNLLDSDFDSGTLVLPAARPESEWSKILWFIVKDRQMVSFSKVWCTALSFEELSETDVLQIDQEIRKLHESIPKSLLPRSISASVIDPPFLILTRLYIEFIHLKTLCILHRRYMARGYKHSTRACVEAGMTMVNRFIDTHKEFSPGGQLDGERWMITNFTVNDFLMGISVLCLYLYTRQKYDLSAVMTDLELESGSKIESLLAQAQNICVEKFQDSSDAVRAARGVQAMLKGESRLASQKSNSDEPILQNRSVATSNNLGDSNSTGMLNADVNFWESFMEIEDAPWAMFDHYNTMGSEFGEAVWPTLGSETLP